MKAVLREAVQVFMMSTVALEAKKAEAILKQGKGKDKRLAVDDDDEESSLKELEKNLDAVPDFGEQAYRLSAMLCSSC